MTHIRRRTLVMAAAAGSFLPRFAVAQSLPTTRPVRLIVPYAAGGTTDVVARLVARHLAEQAGLTVVVENKPGGGGTIAGAQLASSPPDGSTLLLGGLEMATAAALVGSSRFRATRDLAGVAGLTQGPLILVINPQATPARDLPELMNAARARPGELTFASAGVGNVTHLFGEVFTRTAHVDIRHVPYKGAAPALTDLQAGMVSMMFAGTASVSPLVAAGRLRALAVTGQRAVAVGRSEVAPFARSGLAMPETDAGAWLGLFAVKGTPRDAVAALHDVVNRVLGLPDVQAELSGQGLVPQPMSPEGLDAHLAAQTRVWTRLIADAGISI